MAAKFADPLSPLDSVESKQPLQSRLLNTPIFIPFWDGPLHPSKCRKKLILICFKALQLSLIPVLGSWHLFLQTSYFSSLTETLEWSIVLWLVNHSKSLNGQWLVSQSLILRPRTQSACMVPKQNTWSIYHKWMKSGVDDLHDYLTIKTSARIRPANHNQSISSCHETNLWGFTRAGRVDPFTGAKIMLVAMEFIVRQARLRCPIFPSPAEAKCKPCVRQNIGLFPSVSTSVF